jgi:hypothetical protein
LCLQKGLTLESWISKIRRLTTTERLRIVTTEAVVDAFDLLILYCFYQRSLVLDLPLLLLPLLSMNPIAHELCIQKTVQHCDDTK